eukprot:1348791-Amorphochlora_amoeboformis.AAC.2
MATPYVLILALAGARTGLMTTLKSSGMLLSASICAEVWNPERKKNIIIFPQLFPHSIVFRISRALYFPIPLPCTRQTRTSEKYSVHRSYITTHCVNVTGREARYVDISLLSVWLRRFGAT